MRSRALQTSRLLRQSCASLHGVQSPAQSAAQQLIRRVSVASLTTASKPAPRPVAPRPSVSRPAARTVAKPASTVTKPAARPIPEKPASSASASARPPSTQASTPPKLSPEMAVPAPTYGGNGNGNGNGNGKGLDYVSEDGIDWKESYHGVGVMPFSQEAAQILMADLHPDDVEIKPDGIIYLPEIKYRRILNRAFGPGGWGMVPRGEMAVEEKMVTREYALIVGGRFVAQARGENSYFSEEGIPSAAEGCKSNALMRCCKDLGVASELWDPRFIRSFKKTHCEEVWVEHATTKKRRQLWMRKDNVASQYPWQLTRK